MSGLTLPDIGEGDSDLQAILFQEYLEVLVAGINGLDCVLSGLAVTGGADMTPAVAKGAVLSNGTMFAVAAADVTIGTADATNPRIDLIVVNNAGALAVRAGTPGAYVAGVSAPKPPVRSANDVVIASVLVLANDTSIETSKIDDKRMLRTNGPLVIAKSGVKSQANSTATVSIFNTAPIIPSGLFLAGRRIRVTAGGNFLHNTTTDATCTVRILYGGTVIFQDTSVAFGVTADADRFPWHLQFELIANGNADQRLTGHWIHNPAVNTAPATGIGDITTDEMAGNTAIGSATGGIAVDSDAADRTLDIDFDFSAANASIEWVCQGITVELL